MENLDAICGSHPRVSAPPLIILAFKIIDEFALRLAARSAYEAHEQKRMATRSLYTEIIYNLSPSRQVSVLLKPSSELSCLMKLSVDQRCLEQLRIARQ